MGDYEQKKALQEQKIAALQEQKQQVDQEQVGGQFQLRQEDRVAFDEEALSSQLSSQRQFYRSYKETWVQEYEGRKISKSEYADPVELQVQNRNLTYTQKKQRKESARMFAETWEGKMEQLDQEKFGFAYTGKADVYSHDMMISTIKYAAIDKKKDEIIGEVLRELEAEKAKVSPLFAKYLEQIKALGPDINVVPMQTVRENVIFSEATVADYKRYIKKAVMDPPGVLKDAVSDTILSFGRFPINMLDSEAIPQKFDSVKQLRDRYRAASKLLSDMSKDDEVYDQLGEIQADRKLSSNIALTTEMYRRLDADLVYTLKKNGIKVNEDFLDTDTEINLRRYVSTNGQLALDGMKELLGSRSDHREAEADIHWLTAVKAELDKVEPPVEKKKEEKKEDKKEEKKEDKKEDKKEEKKEDKKEDKKEEKKEEKPEFEFKDQYKIAETASDLVVAGIPLDAQKKDLLESLSKTTIALAQNIEMVEKEITRARGVAATQEKKNELRTEVRKRLNWYIRTREQQVLDLMDRVAGFLNAMRYLTGKEKLNPNGVAVLDETQKKLLDLEHDDDEQGEQEDLLTKGTTKELVAIRTDPLTFNQFKKKMLDRFRDDKDAAQFKKLLSNKNAAMRYDILLLQGRDFDSMSLEELQKDFNMTINSKTTVDLLIDSMKAHLDDVDALYERVGDKSLSIMTEQERKFVIERFTAIRTKLFAYNRLKEFAYPSGGSYGSFAMEKLVNDMKGDFPLFHKRFQLSLMKFKLLGDACDIYRRDQITRQILDGTATEEMYSDSEKEELARRIKKVKKVDGKYPQGQSPQDIMSEYFATLQAEAINLKMAHFGEMGNYLLVEQEVFEHENKEATKKDRKSRIADQNAAFAEKQKKLQEETEKQVAQKKEKRAKVQVKKEEKKKKEAEDKEKRRKQALADKHWREEMRRPPVRVQDPEGHVPYEKQVKPVHCWACALSGLMNHRAGKQVANLDEISKLQVPPREKTGVIIEDNYQSTKTVAESMLQGETMSSPMMLGDYVFDKIPGTIMRSVQIGYGDADKKDECKETIRKTIRAALKKGPVAVLRNQHFVLCYGIQGDRLLVKNSTRDKEDGGPDAIMPDHFTIDEYVEKMTANAGIELVWLEDLKGQEKKLAEEFPESFTYDEKTSEFQLPEEKKNQTFEHKGPETLMHVEGLEGFRAEQDGRVTYTVYVPKAKPKIEKT